MNPGITNNYDDIQVVQMDSVTSVQNPCQPETTSSVDALCLKQQCGINYRKLAPMVS